MKWNFCYEGLLLMIIIVHIIKRFVCNKDNQKPMISETWKSIRKRTTTTKTYKNFVALNYCVRHKMVCAFVTPFSLKNFGWWNSRKIRLTWKFLFLFFASFLPKHIYLDMMTMRGQSQQRISSDRSRKKKTNSS